jgi:hypothetical protein
VAVGEEAYRDTMSDVLIMALEFLNEALNSEDEVRRGAYLKMASRSLRCALEIYGDRLAQNRVEMEQGEKSEKV